MSTQATVLVEKSPAGWALVTLNRPEALNALSRELMAALAQAIDALEADPGVRLLILTGAGRAFCAGLDLKEIGRGDAGPGTVVQPETRPDPVRSLKRFSGPIIGAVNGAAVTGGFELALACDVILASSAARFADTHARIGIAPGWGLSQRLSRAIGVYRAREISLTGNFVSAAQAEAWGFVNRVVPPEALLAEARKMAVDMLSAVPEMLSRYKAVINDGFDLAFGEAMSLEQTRCREFNDHVDAAVIERRRMQVQSRGREQLAGPATSA